MTEKMRILLESVRATPFKYGYWQKIVAHINRLERSAAFMRRLAKAQCSWCLTGGCPDGMEYPCWPCQARLVLRGAKKGGQEMQARLKAAPQPPPKQ